MTVPLHEQNSIKQKYDQDIPVLGGEKKFPHSLSGWLSLMQTRADECLSCVD